MERKHDIIYFENSEDFRKWLKKHHRDAVELWVGYYKKGSGTPSITWPESVDEALCFGWIDGLRKSIDENRYKIRFTPRKATSHWSDVNIRKINEQIEAKRVHPAGLEAFNKRKKEKSGRASYEQKEVDFAATYENEFKRYPKAWQFFNNLAPSYKKASIWYVISAKKEETREKRLKLLIECSEKGEKIPQLVGKK